MNNKVLGRYKINKLPNAKNNNVLAVKTFKGEKMLLYRRGGNSTTDGPSRVELYITNILLSQRLYGN